MLEAEHEKADAEEEKSLFYQLCCRVQRFSESADNATADLVLIKALKELIRQIRVQVLEVRDGDEVKKGETLIWNERLA